MVIYKKYFLKFRSIESSFLTFLFRRYKMVDSMDISESLNIDIQTVMKNPELL